MLLKSYSIIIKGLDMGIINLPVYKKYFFPQSVQLHTRTYWSGGGNWAAYWGTFMEGVSCIVAWSWRMYFSLTIAGLQICQVSGALVFNSPVNDDKLNAIWSELSPFQIVILWERKVTKIVTAFRSPPNCLYDFWIFAFLRSNDSCFPEWNSSSQTFCHWAPKHNRCKTIFNLF